MNDSEIWQMDMFQDNEPKWRVVKQGENYCVTEPYNWEEIKKSGIRYDTTPKVFPEDKENWE